MPLQWRLQVLETQVRAVTGIAVRFEETDLYRLQGDELEAVLKGMGEGLALPIALVESTIICAGDLDAERIVRAVGALRSS